MNHDSENIFSTHCTILFDTCSILKGDDFALSVKSLISSKKHKIVILSSVIEELRHLAISEKSTCRAEAVRAYTELRVLAKVGAIHIEGDAGIHEQADLSILKYVSVNRFDSRKMVVVTQDRQLASDILMLNGVVSIPSLSTINVYKIGHGGELIPIHGDRNNTQTNNANDMLKRFGIA